MQNRTTLAEWGADRHADSLLPHWPQVVCDFGNLADAFATKHDSLTPSGIVNFFAPLKKSYPKGYNKGIEMSSTSQLSKFTKGQLVMLHQVQNYKSEADVGTWVSTLAAKRWADHCRHPIVLLLYAFRMGNGGVLTRNVAPANDLRSLCAGIQRGAQGRRQHRLPR